jgi:phage terminase large subunit
MLHEGFDWKNPDYATAFRKRLAFLEDIRAHPEWVPELKAYYRSGPQGIADFISDFGVTYDPRNPEVGLPAIIPFILFPKQVEWIHWIWNRWRSREPGATEKARECGVTWEAVAFSCSVCLFFEGIAVGFGSRKEEYVDRIGTYKPIIPKARLFLTNLPAEFRGGWVPWRDSPFMRVNFPETGSIITGEAGNQIGRGDRTSFTIIDEAEYLEQPELVDFALSQTTNCRIDVSSVNGSANPTARRILTKKVKTFFFAWQDDPRKDDAWYEKQCRDLDPVVVAQEIDRDRSASVQGIVIPGAWVKACIGAKRRLGIAPSGEMRLAFDIGDEGDACAMVGGQGTTVSVAEEWRGKGSDPFASVERAFSIADANECWRWRYDADGMGALVRGDARVINDRRKEQKLREHAVIGFRGSEGVVDPEGIVEGTKGREGDKGRLNKDYYQNRKAQGWWELRRRAQRTFLWVEKGQSCPPDDILDLDPALFEKPESIGWQLVRELSQPTYQTNGAGKIVIDKSPAGMPSPNLGDGCMMRFARMEPGPAVWSPEVLQALATAGRRRR